MFSFGNLPICHSNPEKKNNTKKAKKLQTPDLIALQTMGNQNENPYGTVIPLPEFDETNASENASTDDKPQTIYANLEFLTGTSLADNSSSTYVATDTESSRHMSPIAEADVEVEQIDYNDEQYT